MAENTELEVETEAMVGRARRVGLKDTRRNTPTGNVGGIRQHHVGAALPQKRVVCTGRYYRSVNGEQNRTERNKKKQNRTEQNRI